MNILHLNLKGEYWDDIFYGRKKEEYRQVKPYWTNRMSKQYDVIGLKRGYPKKYDHDKIHYVPWRGFTIKTITHPHFKNGLEPVQVYAIRVESKP